MDIVPSDGAGLRSTAGRPAAGSGRPSAVPEPACPAVLVPPVPRAAPCPSGSAGRTGSVGRRKTTGPPAAGAGAPPAGPAGGIVAVPSAWTGTPSGRDAVSAGPAERGTRGSGPCGAPHDTRRSWSPPKPVCRERSAPHAAAGSGRLPCCASAGVAVRGSGSSSKKCGPVSSAGVGAGPGTWPGRTPAGATSGSPADGAGRLVPGTQAAPFQYRTYPGMDGSG